MLFRKCGGPDFVACSYGVNNNLGMAPRWGYKCHRTECVRSVFRSLRSSGGLLSSVLTHAMLAAPRMPNFSASFCLVAIGGLTMTQLRYNPLTKDAMKIGVSVRKFKSGSLRVRGTGSHCRSRSLYTIHLLTCEIMTFEAVSNSLQYAKQAAWWPCQHRIYNRSVFGFGVDSPRAVRYTLLFFRLKQYLLDHSDVLCLRGQGNGDFGSTVWPLR